MSKEDKGSSNSRKGDLSTGFITCLTGAIIVTYLFMTNRDYKPMESYWFINTGLCLWAPLMAIFFFIRQDPSQFGMQRGDSKTGLKWSFIFWLGMAIVALIAYHIPDVRSYYEHRLSNTYLNGVGPVLYRDFSSKHFNDYIIKPQALLYYELAMGFYMFCWEFFFRGFLLFGLQKSRMGTWGAIVLQTIPFVLLHWSPIQSASKPSPEILGSAIAGIVLGYFAIRTKSFLYGYLTHWAVSLTFDLIIITPFISRHIG